MTKESDSKSQTGNFKKYYLPAIAYGVLIITLSSIPNLSPPLQSKYPVDKLIHFLEYAGFCYFVLRLCTRLLGERGTLPPIILSAVIVALFAVGDETYQRLIPGRSADLFDVLADFSGALVILVFATIKSRTGKRNQEM